MIRARKACNVQTLAITDTPEEIERFRLERLAEQLEENSETAEQPTERFWPGTYGCHEALQMASVFQDSIDRHLCGHSAVLLDPEWFRLASEAHIAIYNLYQAIGERHLNPVKAGHDESGYEGSGEGQKDPG